MDLLRCEAPQLLWLNTTDPSFSSAQQDPHSAMQHQQQYAQALEPVR